MEYDHSTYISPFTWRYGSDEMKNTFSEENRRKLLRKFWVALARAESKAGLVTESQVKELEENKNKIDIKRALEIEKEIKHDLMAEIKAYAEISPNASGIIHLGATSMDALDNVDIIRFKEAFSILKEKLKTLILFLCDKVEEYKGISTMAFTHIQPAEITTIGYRLAQTLQDLFEDFQTIDETESSLKAKGLKGAVGTAASYSVLLENTNISARELENFVMDELGLKAFEVATQVYTRKQDLKIISSLSSLAATLHKFSLDFRILMSPPIGEFSEPFGEKQVGSSAMPFKRNPINSEKIDSLCRLILSYYSTSWQNASLNILERTLDDSANRRIYISESFLALDEILSTEIKIVKGMQIHKAATERLLNDYGIFSATERLLMESVKRGANRQEMHEVIREESISTWHEVQEGKENKLKEKLKNNSKILSYLKKDEIEDLLDASKYTGDAERRCENLITQIKSSPALNM